MKLLPVTAIAPSTYNPRTADPKRLRWIALSLRKLGFLLPIYATPQGEILSGHQRHYVAVETLGWEEVPVEETISLPLDKRKALNLVFNRATNDMARSDGSGRLTATLEAEIEEVQALAGRIADKKGDDRFPCLRAEQVSLEDLVAANSGRWNQYAANVSEMLVNRGVHMPLVARRSDLIVVNGIGRLQVYAARKLASAPAVLLDDEEAQLAERMLNLLTMDFNIHERYADVLRYNSFRRASGRRIFGFGTGMSWPLGIKQSQFDIHNEAHVEVWKQFFGDTVLDFGGGQREDSKALRYAGITADDFEPYPLTPGTDEINPGLSREIARGFLGKVAAGRQWSSIFCSAVFNSVPFQEDRRKIVAIIAALCGSFTTFYTYSSSVTTGHLKNSRGLQQSQNKNQVLSASFMLGYEPNVSLGEFHSRPKMQKYWHQEEFEALMRERFADVQPARKRPQSSLVYAICRQPRPVDFPFLAGALAFEFNLPYPDGSRMNLVEEALDAFSRRLNVDLREKLATTASEEAL